MIKDFKYFFNRTLKELEKLHQKNVKSIWCGKEIDTRVAICDIKKRSNNGLFVLMENVLSTNNLLIYYELMGHLKSILQDKYNINSQDFESIRFELDEKLKELRQKDLVYGNIEERCKDCQFFDESENICTHSELLGKITQSDLKKCNEYNIFRKKK